MYFYERFTLGLDRRRETQARCVRSSSQSSAFGRREGGGGGSGGRWGFPSAWWGEVKVRQVSFRVSFTRYGGSSFVGVRYGGGGARNCATAKRRLHRTPFRYEAVVDARFRKGGTAAQRVGSRRLAGDDLLDHLLSRV